MRNARIDLRLPSKQKLRWQEQAEDRGLDLSEMIRRATDLYLDGSTVRVSPYAGSHGRTGKDAGKATR